ncbi:N-acetyltransferase family protein [Kitasatospora herbaricolor]|uniref:GNAT family N-acetyltransferase n=1 Tax=Kitasatospora herbaricolor TaxID=68217 RepID=UPI0039A73E46
MPSGPNPAAGPLPRKAPAPAVSRLSADGFAAAVPGLADLLADAVAGGASLGFLAPLDREAAAHWWRAQLPSVADGSRTVWVCHGPDGLSGTVSLTLEQKANGRHRGEIVKLMVHRDARGRGLARALLAVAEEAAVRAGATLLLLDTETGSAADHLYRAAGWTRYGIVPEYAADPDGALQDCSFYYKRLD